MAVVDPTLFAADVRFGPTGHTKRIAGWFGGPSGLLGVGLLSALVVLAVAAPLFSGYSPVAIDPLTVMHGPSATHLFGTDDLGRDVFTRVMYGLRTSLAVAAGSVGVALLVGECTTRLPDEREYGPGHSAACLVAAAAYDAALGGTAGNTEDSAQRPDVSQQPGVLTPSEMPKRSPDRDRQLASRDYFVGKA